MNWRNNKLTKVVCVVAMIQSCIGRQAEEKIGEDQLFNRLLKELNVDLAVQDTQVYVLIPRFGCFGCMQRTLLNLQDVENDKIIYLISNRSDVVLSTLDRDAMVYYDTSGFMDRLDLKVAGTKFIKTDNKEYFQNIQIHHDSLNLMRQFIGVTQ